MASRDHTNPGPLSGILAVPQVFYGASDPVFDLRPGSTDMVPTTHTTQHRPRRTLRRAPSVVALAALTITALSACADSEASPNGDVDAGPETSAAAPAEVAMASTPIYAEGEQAPKVEVWKAPTCGCCGDWVAHLEAAGFEVETHEVSAMGAVKAEHGIASEHQSCHTALVDGYLVEGHVPADAIARMLEEKPDIRGLAVPGMPAGSPGMEVASGRKDPYDVLALMQDGSAVVYDQR